MNLAMDLIREALLGGGGGGGGGGIAELIKTQSLGTLSTTSTTEVNTGLTISVPNANVYDILIVLTKAKESPVDYHIGTATILCLNKQDYTGNITNVTTIKNKYMMSHRHSSGGDYIRSGSGSTEYGVYVKNTSYTDNIDVSTVYMKYNSTESGTINGDFDAYVYGIKFPVEI